MDEKSDEFINSLSTQSSVAKFSHSDRGIFGCSLNAQKLVADQCIDGGYKRLNELRMRAVEVSRARKAPGRNSKSELIERVQDLKVQLHLAHQENSRLVIALDELIDLAVRMAGSEGVKQKIVEREIGEVTLRFGI
ncbi:hypothetical protein [Pseudomonas sp. UMAB-40]|uniref:hypothetical protein n=1 Tax=Pseudomonas sp. UMAB-40 TaxID=1365407 RepID=UPI001C581B0A|nr:hypothetical protein [Pseudomonas sp. UMAB-40]